MVFRKIFFALLVAFTFTACTTNDPIVDNQVKTAGALTVQLTTSTYNGKYSPEHVLAIWIESNNGTFVKSLKVGAAERKKYLTNWLGSTSSGNTTDAVTGATLRNHVTHSLNWDGTDVKGALVGDGSYKLCVEFTEDDRTGKYATFAFTKGVENDQQTPADVSGVSNVQIAWTAQ